MTNHVHRIILIVPVAKVAAVTSWFQTTVGANSVSSDLGPSLSASGSIPATHAWCCGSFIDDDCKTIMVKLANLSGVTPPTDAQWSSWVGKQKRSWLLSVQASMRTNYGIWVCLADNAAAWDNPDAQLATMGLKRIQAATP